MKRLLAILCTLALMLGVANPAVFAAKNSSLQAAKDDDSFEIIVLEEDASNLTVNRDTIIDLNGHNIDGVTVLAGTLYCMDSATADYTVADGVYGHVTNVTGNVKAAEGYLQVGDSFHAVNLDIYAMTLRAADVGVYYKSNFAADEVVAEIVENFGVALSVVTAPNASNLDTYCGYSEFSGFEAGEGANSVGTSTLLKNIMKPANGDNKNAKNAAMPVYGRAYIKTTEGYVFGETVKRSLQEQVEAIDGVWEDLTDSQKTPVLSMLEDYTAVMEGWNIPNIMGGEAGEGNGEITVPVEVTAENGIVTESITVEQGAVSITVPAGVKLDEGVTALTLTVTPKETSDAGLTLDKSQVLMPMDVHVEGLAADNAQPITIYLGKVMAENLNMGNYTVYHVENGKANEMVLIPVDAEFTAHNQYKYTLDGELTLYMASFSEVAVVSNVNNVWEGKRDYSWYAADAETLYIRNADQLAAFGAIVGGMAKTADNVEIEQDSFADKTVKLLADISIGDLTDEDGKKAEDGSNLVFYPIGYYNSTGSYNKVPGVTVSSTVYSFEGVFDGNGNTISDFYQNTWEMFGDYNDGYSGTPNHYKDAMGLFGYVVNGTIKNLTVKNFSSDGEFTPTGVIAAYACNSTFENIAIVECNPRVYNTGNGGIVGIGGNSNDPDTYELTFNNITIDNSNKISALWGSWDVACGGLVGMFRGAGHVYMTNCHVAAQIDVNNDVCGNYQYYWYRYSGMLVGTNQNMITDEDGYTVPETEKFHAENCTVHFGTWNDYYYCELVANSLASYTHDHQMSRLVEIKAIDGTTITYLDGTTGTVPASGRVNYVIVNGEEGTDNATCYHFVDGEVWKHENAGIETVNGVEEVLKEDKQHIYLPFKQLFTGYGWGVKHIPIYDDGSQNVFAGVEILPRDVADSVEKFEQVTTEKAYETETTVTIGELFAAIAGTGVELKNDKVQVAVSPVDVDGIVSTAGGVYKQNTSDWTKGTLTFTGTGAATVTITDYYFCEPTTIELVVKSYTEPLKFKTGTKEAYCPACEEYVIWVGLSGEGQQNGVSRIGYKNDDAKYHYYIASDVNCTATQLSEIVGSTQVCLHWNGNNVVSKGRVNAGGNSVLNLMGNGSYTMQYAEDYKNDTYAPAVLHFNGNGTVNIYGGTYISNTHDNRPVMYVKSAVKVAVHPGVIFKGDADHIGIRHEKGIFDFAGTVTGKVVQTNGTLNLANTLESNAFEMTGGTLNGNISLGNSTMTVSGGTINGNISATSGTITLTNCTVNGTVKTASALALNGSVKITLITPTLTGKVTIKDTWTGSVVLDFPVYEKIDNEYGLAYAANAVVSSLNGTLTTSDGNAYEVATVEAAQRLKVKTEKFSIAPIDVPAAAEGMVFPTSGIVTAYCPACNELASWRPSGNARIVANRVATSHYYVSTDIDLTTETALDPIIYANAYVDTKPEDGITPSNFKACVHLNGKTINSTAGIALVTGNGTTEHMTLNIMGEGKVMSDLTTTKVNGNKGVINLAVAEGTINLYGGIYESTTEGKPAIIYSNAGILNVYGNTEFIVPEGTAVMVANKGYTYNDYRSTDES